MFIHSKISWFSGNVHCETPAINAYYHSDTRCNDIKVIYIDRWEISKLIRYFNENPDLHIKIDLISGSNDLIVTKDETSQRIPAQKLQLADEKQMAIWPLSFCDTHFDVHANDDERIFNHVDIQDAVLFGIRIGMVAGQKGEDLIDGLSPKDCAILYANDQEGS